MSLTRRSLLLLCTLVLLLLPSALALAQPPLKEHVPEQVLIKFSAAATEAEKARIMSDLSAVKIKEIKRIKTDLARIAGVTVEDAIGRYKNHPAVEFIEPNYVLHALEIPNDPLFSQLWGMRNAGQTGGTAGADIQAENAWDVFTGSSDVVVGIIDTGLDYNHPDLAANVYTNPGEIPGNGIDDDGNGKVDDVRGWDFVNEDNDPMDDNGHGTHVAGTIGAVGNNGIGVAGVNWHVKIMPLKFLNASGSGSLADAVEAITYATQMNVRLTSNSWGGGGYSSSMQAAIADAEAHGILFVAAAGNAGTDNDATPRYPTSYENANVVSVAATDHNDALASFSCYGATSVDLGAPGVDILSSLPGNSYGLLSGTSMATPHVSGALALIFGRFPAIDGASAKALLLNFVDPIPALQGRCVTGGRLNAFFPIAEPDTIPPAGVTNLAASGAGSNWIDLAWSAPGDDGNTGQASRFDVRWSTAMIDEGNFLAANQAIGTPDPGPAGTPQTMRVPGLAFSTTYYFAVRALDEFGNAGPVSNVASRTTLGAPDIAVAPASLTESLVTGGASVQTLTLQNVAEGTLDFTVPAPVLLGMPVTIAEYQEYGKGAADPRAGQPVIANAGGPDGYGYRWTDSDDPFGPTFAWTDISGTGAVALSSGDDASAGPFPISFPFSYYGGAFNQFWVSSNGSLSLSSNASPYSNQPLPNPAVPAHFIAPFWDDLNLGAGSDIYWQDFGNRVVIQWNQVAHYDGGGPYTFQAILWDDGAIDFQYQAMAAPLNSATIGMQNGDGTDGLTVAFNADYIHDNLAVRIRAVPQWMTVTPKAGTVNAGGSLVLNVNFNATGLLGGDYDGIVRILSNDPDEQTFDVPVALHVTGAPDVAIEPAGKDFGGVFLGASPTADLKLKNIGTDVLHVTGLESTDGAFTLSLTAPLELAPRSSQPLTVTFHPTEARAYAASLRITSDDPDSPVLTAPLAGQGLEPPQFAILPTSLSSDLMTGGGEVQHLTITNSGGADFTFSLAVDTEAQVTVHEEVVLGKEQPDPNAGNPVVENRGGPDLFGYEWIDSDETGGPAFNWVDISGTGTAAFPSGGDDSNRGPFPIGFDFPFYGNAFNQFRVCSNGFLSFTSTSTNYTNQMLPNSGSSVPENLLAAFWDDLNVSLSAGAQVYYKTDNNRLIVQYNHVPRYGTTYYYSFEVILYPNGTILYQYLTMPGTRLNEATIGIQNATKTDGLTVVYNAPYVHDNLAVRFSAAPEWLTVNPTQGTVPPGGNLQLTALFNAEGLFGGTYNGSIDFTTNDPAALAYHVPAALHVTGAPDIALSVTELNFGQVMIGYPKLLQMTVLNMGTDNLVLSGASLSIPDYQVNLEPGTTLAPLTQLLLDVRFSPSNPGGAPATLTFNSNDPDSPSAVVNLLGEGIVPPVAGVAPASLASSLLTGQQDVQHFTLSNTGGSNLDFTMLSMLSFGAEVVQAEYLELGKGETDPRPGILGTGGPDTFGYRWIDSDEPGGPAYGWVDISGTGAAVFSGYSDDSNQGPLPIGFTFPFYGQTFDTFRVCSNGWISFTSTLTAYNNQALPNSGAPENLIAPFWDDLKVDPANGSQVYYQVVDGRLVVQFNNVPGYSSGTGPYTFEVILFPTGTILYQYRSMLGAGLNSATIGVQNAAKNDGLTVVYNANYVHDNLAIRLGPVPQWITPTPASGTVPAGGSLPITVTFDATGMYGGSYAGAVQVLSNDPAHGLLQVTTNLQVTGVPILAVEPASLDFGPLFIGLSAQRTITIRNVGTDQLTVTGISPSLGEYAVSTTSANLAPLQSVQAIVTFTPTVDGSRAAELVLTSNDASSPLRVPLAGIGVIPPDIAVNPTSFETAVMPGARRTKALTVCNTGPTPLTFGAAAAAPTVLQQSYLELGKEAVDPRPGILGTGGPDAFGYTWIDSDEAGGPAYNWVDISAIGTRAVNEYRDDGSYGPFPIGFNFQFYGNDFNEFRVATNGFISFTSSFAPFTNQPLPNSGAPENMVAAFWDDMVVDPSYGGEIYYYNDGSRLIVQYEVRRIANYSPPFYSFEIILYPNGEIVYQYRQLGSTTDSATIGIQNAAKDDGLMAVFNAAYAHDNMAVKFSARAPWLAVEPLSGTVPPGECVNLTVTFNAADLEAGDFNGSLTLLTNDPDESTVTIPALLHVGLMEAVWADFDPNTLNAASSGKFIVGRCELPAGYSAQDIDPTTVTFLNQVPADPDVYSLAEDANQNGVADAMFKFSREAVESILPLGDNVEVAMYVEVANTMWFVARDNIRVIRPHLTSLNDAEWIRPGATINVGWTDPEGWRVSSAELLFSADDGVTWTSVAAGIQGTSYPWTIPAVETQQGRLLVMVYDTKGAMGYDVTDKAFTVTSGATGIPDSGTPMVFALRNNMPNPFNPSTMIRFDLPVAARTDLCIYDLRGRLVRTLVAQEMTAGYKGVSWDGKDDRGGQVPSGVYIYRIKAGDFRDQRRMVLVK